MERTVHGTYWSGGETSVPVEVVHYDDTDEWYVEEANKPETRRKPIHKIRQDTAQRLLDEVAAMREP